MAVSYSLHVHFKTVSQTLHNKRFATVAQPFSNPLHDHFTTVSHRLHKRYTTRLTTVLHQFHSRYTTGSRRLHNPFSAILLPYTTRHNRFTAVTHRLRFTTVIYTSSMNYTTNRYKRPFDDRVAAVTQPFHRHFTSVRCTTVSPSLHNIHPLYDGCTQLIVEYTVGAVAQMLSSPFHVCIQLPLTTVVSGGGAGKEGG